MEIIKGFTVIEGLDGAGTTTQKGELEKILCTEGIKVKTTFEPTDSQIGKLIRKALKGEINIPDLSLAYLYASDRANHIYGKDGILDMINDGFHVISDRYFYSSLAYQSLNIEMDKIRAMNDYPSPENLVFIDLDVKACMERINKRGKEKEIFEKEALLEKIRENYFKAFSYLPKGVNFIKIDGNKSIEEITSEIRSLIRI